MNKICIISLAIPPEHSGAGLAAFKYALRLHKKGKLGLLVTRTKNQLSSKDYYQYLGEEDNNFESKIKRTTAKVVHADSFLSKLLYYPIDFAILYVVTSWILFKNRQHFDIIHCFSPTWFSLIAILAGKLIGKRVVLEITLIDSDDPGYVASYDKFKILYQRRNIQYLLADDIICLSPALVERCKSNKFIDENKIHLISRAYNDNLFFPEKNKKILRKSLGLIESHPLLLFVGRINARKRADILIELVKRLRGEFPHVKLILVGPWGTSETDKKYKIKIINQIEINKLSKNILFTGYISNVHEYMKAADFFLFPSQNEGLPNVVIEAMASGLIVLMNDIEGISNYIIQNQENGFIIQNNEIDSYTTIISNIINHERECSTIIESALRTVKKRFMFNEIDEKYENVYNDI